ncbi:hypothetical protein ACFQL4_16455 [Halosimplex aquaticum]
MTNDTTAADDSAVGRRTLLQALAAAGAFGAATTTAAGQDGDGESGDDADPLYVVEQGDERHEVAPLSGSEPVESFYDLRIPEKYTGDNGATDPGEGPYYMSVGTQDLQRPSTSLLFFYEGPDGVSLVAVHDADGGDGGRPPGPSRASRRAPGGSSRTTSTASSPGRSRTPTTTTGTPTARTTGSTGPGGRPEATAASWDTSIRGPLSGSTPRSTRTRRSTASTTRAR